MQEDFVRYKVKKVLLIRSISEFLNPVLQEMSWHQNCKRCPSTSLYEFLSLNFNSLFSSLPTELVCIRITYVCSGF